MPGKPRTQQAITAYVTPRAADAETTPLEWVLDQVRDGVTVRKIAKDVQKTQAFTCDRTSVLRWMEIQAGGPEALQTLLDEALKESAAACVDMAAGVVEDLGDNGEAPTREQIAYAKLQAEHFQWRAAIYDRNKFGAKPDANVVININQLHLDALRNVAPDRALPAAPVRQIAATAGSGVVNYEDLL